MNRPVLPDNGILLFSAKKEMNCEAVKRWKRKLNAYYYMKPANLKRLHTV